MQVVNKINEKMLEVVNRLRDMHSERGQTSSEYVAVTAVAVVIALTVIYTTLSGALSTAVEDIGGAITDFVGDNFGAGSGS